MIFRKSIIYISIAFIPLSPLNAEIVNPVFSGQLEAGIHDIDVDSCGISIYDYDSVGKIPNAIALAYFNRLEPQSTCTWTIKESDYSDYGAPEDFPGGMAQWNAMVNQPNFVKDTLVRVECLPELKGQAHSQYVIVYPNYICPAGSRYSRDTQTYVSGCTTLPNLCEGDVVARSLDDPVFGFLGHVGLTTHYSEHTSSTGSVMQVMNDHKTLIEKVSFDNFKNDTTYWGDKYGLSGAQIVTNDQANAIIDAEVKQDNKSKGKYRYLPTFIPAQSAESSVYNQLTHAWEAQANQSYPQFRCDTFVDWIHSVALKQIIPFHQAETEGNYKVYKYDNIFNFPIDLYSALLNSRDNGSDLRVRQHNTHINSLLTGVR